MNENIKIIHLTDGSVIHEYIDKIDPIEFAFEYHFLRSPYPIKDYQAKFHIHKINNDECEISWSSDFFPDGETKEKATTLVKSIYIDGINYLRQLISTSL